MNVTLIATRGCSHRANLEHELQNLGVDYELIIVEENPEFVEAFDIRHSPNLMVDGKIVCRGQPSETELRELLMLD
ncbi:MAG: thioredoxin family protein [Thiogranum sp.]|nr:thioredoxin family protein [Thiogranum sp.]